MRLSQLFTHTLREAPKNEMATNARLLERGGFVFKNSAGVYSFLPLGWRVIEKINKIIREEMEVIDGQELLMPALVEKRYLKATDRWNVDIGYKVIDKKNDFQDPGFVLGWTHEEVLTAIAKRYVNSYKDLPFSAYQIQTKFRNEPRAKSGLLRGREFIMKDLYSFHVSEKDLFLYYDRVKKAYFNIFDRCGVKTHYTLTGGGDFTMSNTHEFQAVADVGEDTIYLCTQCGYAENGEISKLQEGALCPECREGKIKKEKSIEVGNIFPLGTKYSEAFDLNFIDEDGKKKPVVMGSYGIGVGRLMATIVELHNDEKGIRWPKTIAPFRAHLIALDSKFKEAEELYEGLQRRGVSVLYDDRDNKTPGERFNDADLLGMPVRLVISEKTLEKQGIEVKKRTKNTTEIINLTKLSSLI